MGTGLRIAKKCFPPWQKLTFLTFVCSSAFFPSLANAGSWRHDLVDADGIHQNLGSALPSVCRLSYLGSAVLIDPSWLVTAAHVVDDLLADANSDKAHFDLPNGDTLDRTFDYLEKHPQWQDGQNGYGYDIALVHLASPVDSIQPSTLYRGSSERHAQVTIAGYGLAGDGMKGFRAAPDYLRRGGHNTADVFGNEFILPLSWTNRVILCDLDSPNTDFTNWTGSSIPLQYEYLSGPGDSGGGWFAEFGDTLQLVGISSGTWVAPFLTSGGTGLYGDVAMATRVSDHVAWIEDTIANAELPEPSQILSPSAESTIRGTADILVRGYSPLGISLLVLVFDGNVVGWHEVQGAPTIVATDIEWDTRSVLDGEGELRLDLITQGGLSVEGPVISVHVVNSMHLTMGLDPDSVNAGASVVSGGRLTDSQGNGIDGAEVTVTGIVNDGPKTTAGGGYYSITGTAPSSGGVYTVTAQAVYSGQSATASDDLTVSTPSNVDLSLGSNWTASPHQFDQVPQKVIVSDVRVSNNGTASSTGGTLRYKIKTSNGQEIDSKNVAIPSIGAGGSYWDAPTVDESAFAVPSGASEGAYFVEVTIDYSNDNNMTNNQGNRSLYFGEPPEPDAYKISDEIMGTENESGYSYSASTPYGTYAFKAGSVDSRGNWARFKIYLDNVLQTDTFQVGGNQYSMYQDNVIIYVAMIPDSTTVYYKVYSVTDTTPLSISPNHAYVTAGEQLEYEISVTYGDPPFTIFPFRDNADAADWEWNQNSGGSDIDWRWYADIPVQQDARDEAEFWVEIPRYSGGNGYVKRLFVTIYPAHDISVTQVQPPDSSSFDQGEAVLLGATVTAANGYTEQPRVIASISGPGGYSYSDIEFPTVTGSQIVFFSPSWDTSSLMPGDYTLEVTTQVNGDSNSGNDSPGPVTVHINSPPALVVAASQENTNHVQGETSAIFATVNANGDEVTDATVVVHITRPDGSETSPVMTYDAVDERYEIAFVATQQGLYSGTVTASKSGHTDGIDDFDPITVINGEPEVEITNLDPEEDGYTPSNSLTFYWLGSDTGTQSPYLEYAFGLDTPEPTNWIGAQSSSLSSIEEGTHTFYVLVRDDETPQLVCEQPATRTFFVDTQRPEAANLATVPDDLEPTSAGAFTVTVDLTDPEPASGLDGVPQLDWFLSGDYYDGWEDMTGGPTTWQFVIPDQDWSNQGGKTLFYRIKVTDRAGNSLYLESSDSLNSPPTLTFSAPPSDYADGLHPNSGDITTGFEYRVTYSDPNGDPPDGDSPRVLIYKNGIPIELYTLVALDAGEFTVGRTYGLASGITLPSSQEYSYVFLAEDSVGGEATGDPTVERAGPTVTATGVASIRIENEAGEPIETTTINFGDSLYLWARAYSSTEPSIVSLIGDVVVQWSSDGTLTPAVSDTAEHILFTPDTTGIQGSISALHADSGANDTTGEISVPVGPLHHIKIEDEDGDQVTSLSVTAGDSVSLFAVGYDSSDGVIGLTDVTWSATGTLAAPTPGPSSSLVYMPTSAPTTGTLHADDGTGHTAQTGTVNVSVGPLHHVKIVDTADPPTEVMDIPELNVDDGLALQVMGFDVYGNMTGSVDCWWSVSGGLNLNDLSPPSDPASAKTFTPSAVTSPGRILVDDLVGHVDNTGLITVIESNSMFVSWLHGDDSLGDGSRNDPWKTISHALDEVGPAATETDPVVIKVGAGTYEEEGTIQLAPWVTLAGGYSYDGGTSWVRAAELPTVDPQYESKIDGQNSRQCVVGADHATLDGFTVANGSASSGGGIIVTSGSPVIQDCVFTNNQAVQNGGGIAITGIGSPVITNNLFLLNTALRSGGAVYNSTGSPVVTNCLFFGNEAVDFGGGVYTRGATAPSISRSLFVFNHAPNGGGLACQDGNTTPRAMTLLTNVLFAGNRGQLPGSSTSGTGGAIFAERAGEVQIGNCTFVRNVANYSEGGANLYNQNSTATIVNSILWESIHLSPIFNNPGGTPPSATRVTYSDVMGGYDGEGNLTPQDPQFNQIGSGDVLGVSVDSRGLTTAVTLEFIIPGSLPPNGAVLWITFDGSFVVPFPIFSRNSTAVTVWGSVSSIGTAQTYEIVDYHLMADSPCIDRGTDTDAPSVDFDGDSRPYDAAVTNNPTAYDMGPDEWVNNPPVITPHSPLPVTMSEDDSPIAWTAPQVVASDVDGDLLTWSVSAPPSNGTANVSGNGSSPATFDYTPHANYVGSDSFAVRVEDGRGGSDSMTVNVYIDSINDVPTIGGTSPTTVTEDNTYAFSPTAGDVDVGDMLTFTIENKPPWAGFNTFTGALTGLPTNNDVGLTSGIVIAVWDDGAPPLSASLPAFNLEVVNVNDAPSIGGTPAVSVPEDSAYAFTPVAGDMDVGYVLTFSIANKPAWASFDIVTGVLAGTPTQSDVGTTEGVVITVTDDGIPPLSASLDAFSVEVSPTNDAPTDIELSDSEVPENAPSETVVGTLVTIDEDLGDNHTYALVAGAGGIDNGSFSIDGDQLRTTDVFDYETKDIYGVRIQTTDSAAVPFEKAFVIQVTDALEYPTVQFETGQEPSGPESDAAPSVSVNVSTPSDETVTVDYQVTGGTADAESDYSLAPGSITFDPDETSVVLPLVITDDTVDEPDETVEIALLSPTNATLGNPTVHTFTILDDDEPPTVQFENSSSSGPETTTAPAIVVTLSSESAKTVSVDYAVTDGTASSPADFAMGVDTLTFDPGQTSMTIPLAIVDDGTMEADETIEITLSSPFNANIGEPSTHVYTILGDACVTPGPPTIITNGGQDFMSGISRITIEGTTDASTLEMRNNGVPLAYTRGSETWSTQVDIRSGTPVTCNFTAWSGAMCESSPSSITITYDSLNDDDFDGILDSQEGDDDPDADGMPNYMDPDSDGDQIEDSLEAELGSAPYDATNLDTLSTVGVPWYVDMAGNAVGLPPRDGGVSTLVYLHNNLPVQLTCLIEYYTQDGVYIGPVGDRTFTIDPESSLAFRPVADDPASVFGGQEAAQGLAVPNRPLGTANGNDNKKNGSLVVRWIGDPMDVQGESTTFASSNDIGPHTSAYLLPPGFVSTPEDTGEATINSVTVPWYVDSAGAAVRLPPRDGLAMSLVYLHNNKPEPITCEIEYSTQDGVYVGPFGTVEKQFTIPANASIAFRPVADDPSSVFGGQEAETARAVPNRPLGTANGNDNKKNGSIVIRWTGASSDVQGFCSTSSTAAGVAVVTAQNPSGLAPHTFSYSLPPGLSADDLVGPAVPNALNVPWYVDTAGAAQRIPPRDNGTATIVYLHNNLEIARSCTIEYYTQDGTFVGPTAPSNQFQIPANSSIAFRPVIDDPASVFGGQEAAAGLAVPNRPRGTAHGNDNKKNGSIVIRWDGRPGDIQGVGALYANTVDIGPHTNAFLLPAGFPTPLAGSEVQSLSVPWYVDNAGAAVRLPPRDGLVSTLIYLHNNRATALDCTIAYYTQDGVFVGPPDGSNGFSIPANASLAFRPVADDPASVLGGQEGAAGVAVPNRPLGTANGNDNKKNGSIVIQWTGSATDVQGVCSTYGSPAGMEPATAGNPNGMSAYSFAYLLPQRMTYTLTYTAGSHGTISGTTPQSVSHGSQGTAVEAVPDPGYHFVQWSDGSTANPRTDTNVTSDLSVTAFFAINSHPLTYTLPGGVLLEMIWIPAGTFMMGRYPGEQDSYSNEDPQHQVTLTQGFWMGKYELTKAQWTAVMGTTPWSGHSYVLNDPDSPAVYVSWNNAQSFITALNGLTGQTFRLPSEAEWEYVCRAGTTTRFYWGDDPSYTVGNAYCWWTYNARDVNEKYAHVVGQKLPNAWGLYDMNGNVWEWCEDDWHSSYTGAPTDGSAWIDSPRGSYRMLRGGGWYNIGSNCRSAYRDGVNPSGTNGGGGFRLAMSEDGFGSVQVSILPAEAIASGAQWRLDDGIWHDSGYIHGEVPLGIHALSFKDVAGWITPAPQSVNVQPQQSTIVDVTYEEDSDSDGLSNAQESLLGTGVNDPDSDDDGLLDGAEVHLHLSNPLHFDSDGDGIGDWEEIESGTDPNSITLHFTSGPKETAVVGSAFEYQATVQGNTGVVTYSLLAMPVGMTVDSQTGLVDWTPSASHAPSVQMTLQADDGQSVAAKTFTINVTDVIDLVSSSIQGGGAAVELEVPSDEPVLGGTAVYVPGNAFLGDASISVQEVSNPEAVAMFGDSAMAMGIRVISAEDPQSPITVTWPYSPADYPPDAQFVIMEYAVDTGQWSEVTQQFQDSGAATVSFSIESLGKSQAKANTPTQRIYKAAYGSDTLWFSMRLLQDSSGHLAAQVQLLPHDGKTPLETIPTGIANILLGRFNVKMWFEANPWDVNLRYGVELYRKRTLWFDERIAEQALLFRCPVIVHMFDEYLYDIEVTRKRDNCQVLETLREQPLAQAEDTMAGNRWFANFGIKPEPGAEYYVKASLSVYTDDGLGYNSTNAPATEPQSSFATYQDADSDGLSDSLETGSANSKPSVSIQSPINGSTLTDDATAWFQGSANDAEDGALSEDALRWTSSIEGRLGIGTAFNTNGLAIGDHEISLTATDSQGAMNSTSVLLHVIGSGDPEDNQYPTFSIVTPTSIQSGDVTIEFAVSDPEGDSNDFWMSWGHTGIGAAHPATISSTTVGTLEAASWGGYLLRNVPPGAHSFVWNSLVDLPLQIRPDVFLGMSCVAPNGRFPSAADTEYFTVDNYQSGNSDIIMLPGNVPLEMIWVPAGTFMMGRYAGEQDSHSNEDPQHQVTLTQGFWMGKYEVTQAQWEAVMGSNPSYFSGANRPVERVSWNMVQAFITELNSLTGEAFRLPTEAQWEYACRAGTTTRFYWGEDPSYSSIDDYAWYMGVFSTHDAGRKLPNAWGLYDMSGNVWEWCQDYYHSSYTGAPSDGSAWESPTGSYRVLRGGGWSHGDTCRSAYRDTDAPSYTYDYFIGFRLAR